MTSASRRQEIRVPVLASAPSLGSGDFPVCPPPPPSPLRNEGRGLNDLSVSSSSTRGPERWRPWSRSRNRPAATEPPTACWLAQNSPAKSAAHAGAASWAGPVASTLWPLHAQPVTAEVDTRRLHAPWDAQVPVPRDQPASRGHPEPGGQAASPNPGPSSVFNLSFYLFL